MQASPLDSIRDLYAQQQLLEIDEDILRKVADNVDVNDLQEKLQRVPPPLNFNDTQEEVNLLVLNHLLNIGAQFSDRVNVASQENLHDVILFGVLGMFIAHSKLDASFFASCGPSDVSSLFNIPMTVPTELQPGITMDQPGPLADFAQLLSTTLQRTGRKLMNQQYSDLGDAVLRTADEGGSAIDLLAKLTQLVDDLDDVETVEVEGTVFQIPFQKNAQRLVADLYHRFHARSDTFSFSDYSSLYAAPSSSSISTLIQLGVLKLKGSPAVRNVEQGVDNAQLTATITALSATPEACTLTRAVAILAIHRIVESMEGTVHPFDMSLYCEQYNEHTKPQYVPCVGDKW